MPQPDQTTSTALSSHEIVNSTYRTFTLKHKCLQNVPSLQTRTLPAFIFLICLQINKVKLMDQMEVEP